MPCYKPLTAYRGPPGTHLAGANFGGISFDVRHANIPNVEVLKLPCGRCVGCRLERSRQWAMRCVHEASLYDYNNFITLTYDDEHLPNDLSLNVEDYQLFMKRLRKKFGDGIRFFHCGEYGEKFERPHHHAIIFNCEFSDKVPIAKCSSGYIYHSDELSSLWGKGFVSIGDVTFESCAYVARYIMKKITGDMADEHYQGRMPEYITMSRRPGIASDWFSKYSSDVYPKDFVTIRDGIKCKPPRYYDKLYSVNHGDSMHEIKKRRLENVLARDNADYTDERLAARESAVSYMLSKSTKRKID